MKIPHGPPDPPPRTGHMPDATPGERIEAWIEMMDEHERFTREWFAERIEPGQDLDEVLREYYRQKYDEHESTLVAMVKELGRREAEAARRKNKNKYVE